MKNIKLKLLGTALAAGLLVGTASFIPASLATDMNAPFKIAGVNEKLKNGNVDWTQGIIRVKGTGAAPENVMKAQKRPMALQAARADAYRKLAEIISGVKVDSTTIVKNFVTESDEVKLQVNALIKGAREVGQAKYFDDGTVEVEMAISIYGPSGLFDIVEEKIFQKENIQPTSYPTNVITPPPSPTIENTPNPVYSNVPTPIPPTIEPTGDAPTGLIIDCRKLGVQPSMSPSIKDPAGNELYIGRNPIDPDFVVNIGIVGYASTPQDAQKNVSRIGNKPLMLKAIRADGPLKADIVISSEHAKALLKADSAGHFLQGAKVIILL